MLARFYVGIRVCDASTRPPPSIPLEQPASGSRRVSRQSSSPVDPAEYPARAARQWIPPSISPELLASGFPPERLASGSRRVSHQSSLPVDPAEYPAEYLCRRSCRVSGQYRAGAARIRQWIASIPPEQLASLVLLNVPPGAQLGLQGSERVILLCCFEL